MAIFKIPGNGNDHTEIYANTHTHSLTHRNAVSKKRKHKKKGCKRKVVPGFCYFAFVNSWDCWCCYLPAQSLPSLHHSLKNCIWMRLMLVLCFFLVVFVFLFPATNFINFCIQLLLTEVDLFCFCIPQCQSNSEKKWKKKRLFFHWTTGHWRKKWVENDWNSMKNGNKPAFKLAHPTRWQRNICWPVWSGKILNCEHLSFQLYPNRNNRLFYALSRIYSTFFILWIFLLFFFLQNILLPPVAIIYVRMCTGW